MYNHKPNNQLTPKYRLNCNNPFEQLGALHNTCLENIFDLSPTSSPSISYVCSLSKSEVLNHTTSNDEEDIVNGFTTTHLSNARSVGKAIVSRDENTVRQYYSQAETDLLFEVYNASTASNLTLSESLNIIKAWECSIIDNTELSDQSKNKLLVFGSVFRNNIDYWVNFDDVTPAEAGEWAVGDDVGAGIGFGGWWGALIGAVAGSLLVEFGGWEVYVN